MATRSLASSLGASAPRDDARERAAMTSVGTDTAGPQFKAPCSIAGEVFIVLLSLGTSVSGSVPKGLFTYRRASPAVLRSMQFPLRALWSN